MRHAFVFNSSSNLIRTKEDLKNKLANQKLQFKPDESSSFPDALNLSKAIKTIQQNGEGFRSHEEINRALAEIKITKEKYRKLEKELTAKGRSRSLELMAVKCKIEALSATYFALKWTTGEWHDLDVIHPAN